MKFLFLDEFKYDLLKSHKIYGLTGIVIDSQHYLLFKESFSVALKKIGWDKKYELKGRSMFSTSGDRSVDVKERVNFMSDVVGISKSKSGKTAKIHVFVAIGMYDKELTEYECYKTNLEKIVKKLPKPSSKNKSLVGVFYDQNSCINNKDFQQCIDKYLNQRNLNLFESPYSVKSSLENPGIMFADYVCYFNQSFFQLSGFRESINTEILALLEKNKKKTISDAEKKKLSVCITNYRKERKTKELILALKKIVFV